MISNGLLFIITAAFSSHFFFQLLLHDASSPTLLVRAGKCCGDVIWHTQKQQQENCPEAKKRTI